MSVPNAWPAGSGLYIHLPFCRQKCRYCDFASYAGMENKIDTYLDALDKEAASYSGASFDTLYIGGGTPSLLSVAQLEKLCARVQRHFGALEQFAESTLEANPESLTAEKARLLRARGLKRLSIGLQSFEDRVLKRIGRVHSVEMFLHAYEMARAAGFGNINVDLIAGLPDQTEADFLRGVQRLIALRPEHISVYALQVEEGTPFYREGVIADEDLVRREWEQAHFLLAENGYTHYEISNFARPGFESKHNLNYWKNGSYLGLGAAAASYQNGTRRSNVSSLDAYLQRVQAGQTPTDFEEHLSGKEREGEQIMLGLRMLGGVPLSAQQQALFQTEIAELAARGLVEQNGDLLKLTFEGMFVANQAFMAFVGPFEK